MTVGSILFGVAALAIVVAYVARPFRPSGPGLDRTIETWVSQMGALEEGQKETAQATVGTRDAEPPMDSVNYCPQCGQRVEQDARFCSHCGTRLRRA